MIFILGFAAAFIISAALTPVVRKLAWRYHILDVPRPEVERKIHKKPTPLMGGLGVIVAFNIVATVGYFTLPLLRDNIPVASMAAIWLGSLVLAVGGVIDDAKSLTPGKLFLFPLIAALIVVFSEMGVTHITNPLGGQIDFSGPAVLGISLMSALFVFFWLSGMIYTTRFLDGLDGLATSVGTVAAFVLFALSFSPQVQQSYTALLAIIAAGALGGFLIFNWHPASIFLGESGSTFIGFILGILSIIAGGKIATAFLVMGVPILDVAWVIGRRLAKRASPFKADKGHLHFRLLALGLSHRQIVGIFAGLSLLFGGTALLVQSFGKLVMLIVLALVMVFMAWVLFTVGSAKRTQGD